MKNSIIIICISILTSCINGQKKDNIERGKNLDLNYEILSKKNLFPSENIEFYSGYLILEIPKGSKFVDIAESIKAIGLKENLCRSRIFISKTGYLMEIDSIPSNFSDYDKSYFANYDLLTKGLNWKFQFKAKDINFKVDLPLKIDMK